MAPRNEPEDEVPPEMKVSHSIIVPKLINPKPSEPSSDENDECEIEMESDAETERKKLKAEEKIKEDEIKKAAAKAIAEEID